MILKPGIFGIRPLNGTALAGLIGEASSELPAHNNPPIKRRTEPSSNPLLEGSSCFTP